MCQFASFVLTKDRELWGPTDSHESIIEHHHLPDGAERTLILRVEILPSETPRDLSTWTYHVDQDWLPEWTFDGDPDPERRVREALARRAESEHWFAHVDSQQAVVGYGGTANAGDGGTATAGDGGTATAGYCGTANAGKHGEIRIRYWDPKSERYRVAVGYVGEDGIEPNTAYVVRAGRLERKESD